MSPSRIYEEITPTYEFAREEGTETLLLELSGFKKEQVKVQIDSNRKLRITGERPLNENRWARFCKEFQVADDCNLNSIRAKFNNDLLYVILPKLKATSSKKNETAKEPKSAPTAVIGTTPSSLQYQVPEQKDDKTSKPTDEKKVNQNTEQKDDKSSKPIDEKKVNQKTEQKETDQVKESKPTAQHEDDNKFQKKINDKKTTDSATQTQMVSNDQSGNSLSNLKLKLGTLGSGDYWTSRQLMLNVTVAFMIIIGLGLYVAFKLKNRAETDTNTTD